MDKILFNHEQYEETIRLFNENHKKLKNICSLNKNAPILDEIINSANLIDLNLLDYDNGVLLCDILFYCYNLKIINYNRTKKYDSLDENISKLTEYINYIDLDKIKNFPLLILNTNQVNKLISNLASLTYNIANSYLYTVKFEDAIKFYEEAANLDNIPAMFALSSIFSVSSLPIFNLEKGYNYAKKYAERVLKIDASTTSIQVCKCCLLFNAGLAYKIDKNYEKALEMFENSKKINERYGFVKAQNNFIDKEINNLKSL